MIREYDFTLLCPTETPLTFPRISPNNWPFPLLNVFSSRISSSRSIFCILCSNVHPASPFVQTSKLITRHTKPLHTKRCIECGGISMTRMHSSRMRTGRSLTVCRSLLPGGVCFRGVSAPGGCGIPAFTEADTPPVNRMTNRRKIITLATISLRQAITVHENS